MSSGTQIETDWMGIAPAAAAEGGAGGPATPLNTPPGGGNGAGSGSGAGDGTGLSATAQLTDEEILGMEPVGISPSAQRGYDDGSHAGVETDSSGKNGPRNDSARSDAAAQRAGRIAAGVETEMPSWMAALTGDPKVGAEAQHLWQEHQAFRAAFSSADEAQAMRELLPGGAQEVQALRQIAQEVDSLRVVAQEAESLRASTESLREAAQSVDRIDAAIFSGDVRAQSEVVTELARANPAAFRSLFAEAAKVLAGMGQTVSGTHQFQSQPGASFNSQPGSNSRQGPTLRDNGEGWGTTPNSGNQNFGHNSASGGVQQSGVIPSAVRNFSSINNLGAGATRRDSSVAPASQGLSRNENLRDTASYQSPATRHESPVTNPQSPSANQQSGNFDPVAYASFERTTNDVVARDVRGSINDTLARVMPEGVAEGAARRIGDDIFNEVHRALAADRTLSEQVGEVLRDRRFGTAEHQRVAALVAGRAKQIVPSVARRVIGEWTSSVLGTARNKAARQAAAAARVDIAAPGGSLDSMPLRAMSSREVNYASMSDDDILGM